LRAAAGPVSSVRGGRGQGKRRQADEWLPAPDELFLGGKRKLPDELCPRLWPKEFRLRRLPPPHDLYSWGQMGSLVSYGSRDHSVSSARREAKWQGRPSNAVVLPRSHNEKWPTCRGSR
jgi:hypothetical protein